MAIVALNFKTEKSGLAAKETGSGLTTVKTVAIVLNPLHHLTISGPQKAYLVLGPDGSTSRKDEVLVVSPFKGKL